MPCQGRACRRNHNLRRTHSGRAKPSGAHPLGNSPTEAMPCSIDATSFFTVASKEEKKAFSLAAAPALSPPAGREGHIQADKAMVQGELAH